MYFPGTISQQPNAIVLPKAELLTALCIVCLTGCQGSAQSPAKSPSEQEASTQKTLKTAPEQSLQSTEQKVKARQAGAEEEAPQMQNSMTLEDERVSNGNDSLPELTIRSIGMHIGGSSNTRADKQPWLSDLTQAEGAVLACQSLARQPLKGGVIGLEYYVGRRGGQPEIRSIRHQLGEARYDQCLRNAFQEVIFHEPRQPTVVSCAFRLTWQDLPK